jgi:hypothetical protein
MHFLPFNKANRDEEFTPDDNGRVAPIFSNTNAPAEDNVRVPINTLKTYMDTYRAKLGKKTEEFK